MIDWMTAVCKRAVDTWGKRHQLTICRALQKHPWPGQ